MSKYKFIGSREDIPNSRILFDIKNVINSENDGERLEIKIRDKIFWVSNVVQATIKGVPPSLSEIDNSLCVLYDDNPEINEVDYVVGFNNGGDLDFDAFQTKDTYFTKAMELEVLF